MRENSLQWQSSSYKICIPGASPSANGGLCKGILFRIKKLYFFPSRILFVCKTSHTHPWPCRHTTVLILLWFMFHSLHISKAQCTDLQPTSRLVNGSLEVLPPLGELCSAEVRHKIMGFNTCPTARQQKFSPYFIKAGLDQGCSGSGLILLDFHSSHLHHSTSIHWLWQASFPHPFFLSPLCFSPSLLSFAQPGSSHHWFLQALIYEWYKQHFGNLPLRANFLLCGTPAFNSRERKQPPQ